MFESESPGVLRDVRTLFGVGTLAAASDDQLLERFRNRDDDSAEAAFEAIVRRHGPMVWGVCRRYLNDPNDVADAFQATFLILANRADSIRGCNHLSRWLHGVSRKVATRARRISARRLARESQPLGDFAAPRPDTDRAEWFEMLDLEISRLPARYKDVVVLCDLGGLTHEEAAHRLGCAVGTIGSRVSRARERLRAGLMRRGFTLSAGALAAGLESQSIAAIPPILAALTVRTAVLLSQTPAVLGTSTAANLMRGVMTSMFIARLKPIALGFLMVVVAAGVGQIVVFGRQKPRGQAIDRAIGSQKGFRKPEARPSLSRADAHTQTNAKSDLDPKILAATNLARSIHAQAAAIDRLPRFSYQVRYR